MTQVTYIFLIILTIAGAFFLVKRLTNNYLIGRIVGILVSGGWIIWTITVLSMGSLLFNAQLALILITFLTCYIILKMRQRKENLEVDNIELKDKYDKTLNERDEYKDRYKETLKEKEYLEQGTKDTKKRRLFQPFIDIFKMLRKRDDQ